MIKAFLAADAPKEIKLEKAPEIDHEGIEKAVEKKLKEKEHLFKQEVQDRLDVIKKKYEEEITKLKHEQSLAAEEIKEEKKQIEEEKKQLQKDRLSEKKTLQEKIITPAPRQEPESQQVLAPDSYLESLRPFFQQKKIEVLKSEIIKKKSELNLIIKVPSEVGIIEYFAKAKNKKKINEADLSMAFLEGREKNLPIIFISQGEMTKKAKLLLETKLKGMAFVKV